MRPDLINGLFELGGGIFIWMHIWKLHLDKKVRGVHWMPVLYMTAWGYWNLYYYPFLKQWASLVGGILVMVANTVWICQILYYLRKEK